MEFAELTLPQQVAEHENELRALEDEMRQVRRLLLALVDQLAMLAGSAEQAEELKALLALPAPKTPPKKH